MRWEQVSSGFSEKFRDSYSIYHQEISPSMDNTLLDYAARGNFLHVSPVFGSEKESPPILPTERMQVAYPRA